MAGDDKTRFCIQCNKHIHDLSAISRAEAEAFCRRDPTACVRFTRNELGLTLTADSGRTGWFRKVAWIFPTWLGLSAGAGCMQVTQGAPCPPRLETKVDSEAIRIATQTANDIQSQLNQPLELVLSRFG